VKPNKGLVIIFEPLVIKDDVQHNVKHKLDFDGLKLISKQQSTSTL
jgi:hypothetical protein